MKSKIHQTGDAPENESLDSCAFNIYLLKGIAVYTQWELCVVPLTTFTNHPVQFCCPTSYIAAATLHTLAITVGVEWLYSQLNADLCLSAGLNVSSEERPACSPLCLLYLVNE